MTREEAIAYMEAYGRSGTQRSLKRIRELLEKLGNPQKELKFVHVAGSNGKGSTCAMLEAVLRGAGYRTGLFISPYIQNFCERIQVAGECIPGEALGRITERVRETAENMAEHPYHFELVTAVAMLYFAERQCEITVLETGLGGLLDSTNVIDPPEVAVITNLGLEHTEVLGNTLAEIAAAKAGIIKPGSACVCYESEVEAVETVRAACGKQGVPFHLAAEAAVLPVSASLDGQVFRWQGETYRLGLLGAHQLRNAGTVLETIRVLRERGWRIPEEAVRTGLAETRWPARLEVLRREPPVLLDGGHNPQCAEALANSLKSLLGEERAVFLTGVLREKDYPRMMACLMPLAREFVCLSPGSSRALTGEELAAFLQKRGVRARVAKNEREGLAMALDAAGGAPLVIFGSLYLAGAVRTAYERREAEAKERDG